MSKYFRDVLQIFEKGVSEVTGFNSVGNFLNNHKISGNYQLIAIGKAADSMSLAVMKSKNINIENGIVITKENHLSSEILEYENLQCIESSHPSPTEKSINAGERLINFIESTKIDDQFLILISGGGSSLVECLSDGVTLDELKQYTEHLLSKGYNISEINNFRKKISKIKGGKLSIFLNKRKTLALYISDVPEDKLSVIASGPLVKDDNIISDDAYDDFIKEKLLKIKTSMCPPDDFFKKIENHIVAKIENAKRSCEKESISLGYKTFFHEKFIEGDVKDLSNYFSEFLHSCDKGLHIWGGESSVMLPNNPGRGGRNQQLALLMAKKIRGKDIIFLSAGTDGTDGPTNDAGGIVDGETEDKGFLLGLDIDTFLNNADAGSYLNSTDSLVTTGPTGTNVMDLIIALKN